MLDWKIITAAFVTLIALLAALAGHPAVKDFFSSVGGKIPAFGEQFAEGNLSFSLSLDKEPLVAEAGRRVNITIDASSVSAEVKEVTINPTDKEIRIRGYEGFIAVNGTHIELNGTLERFEMGEVFIVRGPVYLSGDFERAEIEGLALKEFAAGSGLLVSAGNEIKFSSGLKLEYVIAKFVFADKLLIEGTAKRITSGNVVIS